MSVYLDLLRNNRGYRLLWFAQVVSLAGDWFNTIALSALVVAYSPGQEGVAVSAFLLARFIPPMLISPITGLLIDRFDRKKLLIWSNLLRAVVVFGFLLTTQGAEWLPVIYILTIIQFTLSAVFEPGQSAYIPSLVRANELVIGNTLVSITWSVMLAIGAMLGGVVASAFGANAALLIDGLSFLLASLLIVPVKPNPESPAEIARTSQTTETVKEVVTVVDGVRFLRRHPEIASTLIVKFSGSLGNVDTLMAIYATQLFVLGEGGQLSLGIMYGVFGVGSLVSPLIANRFSDGSVRSLRRFIFFFGLLFCTLGWAIMGVAGSLIGVCIALFVRAMGGSINWTYSNVIYQKTTPDAFLGRVFSFDMAGFYLATVISTIVHGTLIDQLGTENVSVIAIGTGLVSVVPLAIWGWVVRRLERSRQPVYPAEQT